MVLVVSETCGGASPLAVRSCRTGQRADSKPKVGMEHLSIPWVRPLT